MKKIEDIVRLGPVIPVLRDRIFTQRDPYDYADLDWLYRHQPEAS